MKESEIRPKEIFEQYLKLSRIDGEKLDKSQFIEVDCPACSSSKNKPHLEKLGFQYKICQDCFSLFCSPRPTKEQLDQLYFSSESSHFWSNVFFPSVAEVRREKLFRPKAREIYDYFASRNITIKNICDVGAGHGMQIEELGKCFSQVELFAIEPDANSVRVCREKGITVFEDVVENAKGWNKKFNLVTSYEVLEHVFDVNLFIKSLWEITANEGYCLVTGLIYDGFDILTLQEKSNSIYPPHHLNFMSAEGLQVAFKQVGFSQVDLFTPGKLDVDIVINSNFENEFVRVLKRRGEEAVADFQKFLQRHKLSSHAWLIAKK